MQPWGVAAALAQLNTTIWVMFEEKQGVYPPGPEQLGSLLRNQVEFQGMGLELETKVVVVVL